MSLETVCQEIAALAARPGTGIAVVHNDPPESIGRRFPVSWVNPLSGRFLYGADDPVDQHTIELIVYAGKRIDDLPTEFETMKPLVGNVKAVFWTAYRDGTLGLISPSISKLLIVAYSLDIRYWGSDSYHAVTFTIEVEEQE